MAAGFHIAVSLPPVPSGVVFTATARAVRDAGEFIRQAWAQIARDQIGASSGSYVQSLELPEAVQYPFDGDPMAIGVFNNAKHANVIDEGHASFNLADRIRWGQTPKSRQFPNGRWYIIVPFRHYTPPRAGEGATPARTKASMPKAIHAVAKGLAYGERLTFRGPRTTRRVDHKAHTRVTGKAASAHRRTAKSSASFGAALQHARSAGKPTPSPFHKSSKYEGLTKTGSKGHTQYMTWRIITQDSVWMIPAKQGKHLARQAHARTRPIVATMIKEAFAQDLQRIVTDGLAGNG